MLGYFVDYNIWLGLVRLKKFAVVCDDHVLYILPDLELDKSICKMINVSALNKVPKDVYI